MAYRHSNLFVLLFLPWAFFIPITHPLTASETQVLLQLRKHLEYPVQLDTWENYNGDWCSLSLAPHVSVRCQDNSVSELKIMGDKFHKVSEFNGFAIPNQTLSERFSMDSFVTTLTRLSRLRVLSLVSLGIWGPLPDKIHRLNSLAFLDMSSNFMFGSIPPQMYRVTNLHTLALDDNYFNDTIPGWLDSFSNLTILRLKNNHFKGQFPSSVCKITTLTDIVLSHNDISGKLPDMSTLSGLHLLDLRENHFDSELPLLPKGLTTVLLSKNLFTGKIPQQYGNLNQLQHLDLSINSLSGTPPTTLFSLPRITYLNLASNMLSGSLPNRLSCGDELGFVDISSNRLMGGLPSCLDTTSDKRVVKFDYNCLSADTQLQHSESYCKRRKHSKGKEITILVGVIGGTVIATVLVAVGILILLRKYCLRGKVEQRTLSDVVQDNSPSGISSELLANARIISQAAKLGTQVFPGYKVYSVEELEEATNNFDQLTLLGEGSTGKLYKGRLENGTHVAIRSLVSFKKYSIRNLKLRLDLLSKLRHPHLVGLLGHCIDGGGQEDSTVSRVFLVYEYVANGNFHAHLSESCPEMALNWPDRLTVLIGIAKAVHFLHAGIIPVPFSNQLKTSSILLDEHRVAKLSDYGMAIITEDIEKLEAKGEGNKSWHMTKREDDVYNFGLILLESLMGPAVGGKGEVFLSEMVYTKSSFGSQDGGRRIVDPIVLTTSTHESLKTAVTITTKCLSADLSKRPSLEDVLWNLQYAAQVQAAAESDQRSDAASQS